ncbi:2,3-bisphosphoglycerate-independent phosphoglycerate mutase [Candidatus Shapirobacteria bacterium]|nr:2,3-bisphosphoglycerate-independent phosphoglycerate mutase [Candidatus Shapirobacteria bacterium]
MLKKPLVLIILDGWGLAPAGPGNAVTQAKTPTMEYLWRNYFHTQLLASGEAVGLPKGEMGSSETGHLNLGAGRIVPQDLPRISKAISDGSFFQNKAFLAAISHARFHRSSLHIMGLLSDGGVHSGFDHLLALLELCKKENFTHVFLHLFTDGRDMPPKSSQKLLFQLDKKMKELEVGKIATIMGRYYAMDRDLRWERTERAYRAILEGIGKKAEDVFKAVENSYRDGITDEFIEPVVITEKQRPVGRILDNHAVIFFNFRVDRPRQLTKSFLTNGFKNLFFATMTEYEKGLPVSAVAFSPIVVASPLAQILSGQGVSQLHLSESEKERFVTYYFDGQREKPFFGESWLEVPSPKVTTYDLKPEMSAEGVYGAFSETLLHGATNFFLLNFANPDIVGHTGVLSAGIKACETVDFYLGKIVEEMLRAEGIVIVTADHGNVEEMLDLKTGEVNTEHSTNPVPFILVSKEYASPKILSPGILGDVAPTILKIMGIPKPREMTGQSLI